MFDKLMNKINKKELDSPPSTLSSTRTAEKAYKVQLVEEKTAQSPAKSKESLESQASFTPQESSQDSRAVDEKSETVISVEIPKPAVTTEKSEAKQLEVTKTSEIKKIEVSSTAAKSSPLLIEREQVKTAQVVDSAASVPFIPETGVLPDFGLSVPAISVTISIFAAAATSLINKVEKST